MAEFNEKKLREEIPELPWEKRSRLVQEYGVKKESAEMFVQNNTIGMFFEDVVRRLGGSTSKWRLNLQEKEKSFLLSENYITSDVVSLMKQSGDLGKISPENFTELITMVMENKISSRGAKDILAILYAKGGSPEHIAEQEQLIQKSDHSELAEIVKKIIGENESVVNEYKAGKSAALQFLIGQVMKASKGSANPQLVKEILLRSLMV